MSDPAEPDDLDSFLASRRAAQSGPVSALLWILAIGSYVAYVGTNLLAMGFNRTMGVPELVAGVIGLSIWPLGLSALFAISKRNRNLRTMVKVFFIASLALFLLAVVTYLVVRGYVTYQKQFPR